MRAACRRPPEGFQRNRATSGPPGATMRLECDVSWRRETNSIRGGRALAGPGLPEPRYAHARPRRATAELPAMRVTVLEFELEGRPLGPGGEPDLPSPSCDDRLCSGSRRSPPACAGSPSVAPRDFRREVSGQNDLSRADRRCELDRLLQTANVSWKAAGEEDFHGFLCRLDHRSVRAAAHERAPRAIDPMSPRRCRSGGRSRGNTQSR